MPSTYDVKNVRLFFNGQEIKGFKDISYSYQKGKNR
jgi:hypothetical protein